MTRMAVGQLVRHRATETFDHALDRVGFAIGNRLFDRTVERYPSEMDDVIQNLPGLILHAPELVVDVVEKFMATILDVASSRPSDDPPAGGFRWGES